MKLDGLEVVDATTGIYVEINDDDVRRGKPKRPEACAAARACVRTGCAIEARVYRARTYLKQSVPGKKPKWVWYVTPGSLRSEIVAIDRGGKFEPGQYYFRRPSKTMRLGHRDGSRPNHKPKKSTPRHITVNIREHGPHGER